METPHYSFKKKMGGEYFFLPIDKFHFSVNLNTIRKMNFNYRS